MENWRNIPGWEGFYEASDLGNIRSITRVVERDFVWNRGRKRGRGTRTHEGRVLKIFRGHGRSTVRLSGRGRKVTAKVHRLVAEAFLGPMPHGFEVAHNNGDPHDNRLCNLRYATPKENAADKVLHGTQAIGVKAHNCKLTEDQVRSARALKWGEVGKYARAIGVKPALLYQVRRRDTWRHI